MGNYQKRTFKNFHIPDVTLNSQLQTHHLQNQKPHHQQLINDKIPPKMMTLIPLKQSDNFPLAVDQKFVYKTFSLKTKKQIAFTNNVINVKQIPSLKVLTYNIWFQNQNMQSRTHALMKILKETSADIICLQQVTQQFLQVLWQSSSSLCTQSTDWYYPEIPMHWYDTMILSKYPLRFYQIPFAQSFMQRKLLVGACHIKKSSISKYNEKQQQIQNEKQLTFTINCVHLESLSNQKLRIQQLEQIKAINKNVDIVCLVGDMNFDDNWNQDKILKQEYIDLWMLKEEQMNKSEKKVEKWTMPKTSKFIEWRPDHILLRNNQIGNKQFLQSGSLQTKIQRIGVFTIPPFQNDHLQQIKKDGIVRTPSDHMGLLGNIRF